MIPDKLLQGSACSLQPTTQAFGLKLDAVVGIQRSVNARPWLTSVRSVGRPA
jgi:hypothetical protein